MKKQWNKKRLWPIRKVIEQQQIFTDPGYILERLSCGHEHRDYLDDPFPPGRARRCRECAMQPQERRLRNFKERVRKAAR